MGKTFKSKKKRRTKLSKTQRQKDRRRIRSKNRSTITNLVNTHDETHFIKTIQKNWPCLFQNHSTIPNKFCSISFDEISFMTLLELGNLNEPLYTHTDVKCMNNEQRIDACIKIIKQVLSDEKQNSTINYNMLYVLQYFVSCKKQLLRRGNITSFKGHPKKYHVLPTNTNEVHVPKLPQIKETNIKNETSKTTILEDMMDAISLTPKQTNKEQFTHPNAKMKIAKKIQSTHTTSNQQEEPKQTEESSSWSCQIM